MLLELIFLPLVSSSGLYILGLHENNTNYVRVKRVMILTFFNRLKKMLNYGAVSELCAARASSHLMVVKFLSQMCSTQAPWFRSKFFCTSVSKLFNYWSICQLFYSLSICIWSEVVDESSSIIYCSIRVSSVWYKPDIWHVFHSPLFLSSQLSLHEVP